MTVSRPAPDPAPSARLEGGEETAARLSAFVRHLFLYDRGSILRVMEESGLSMTQCKTLLELGGLGHFEHPQQVGELAEALGVSVPSMSRAVDALVKKGLATRVEDADDRRIRRVAIAAKGRQLVETLLIVRQAGMKNFVATLTDLQRAKLDEAIDALMDREDIAVAFRQMRGVASK